MVAIGNARTVLISVSLLASTSPVLLGYANTASASPPGATSGRLSSSLYFYDRADSTREGVAHARASQTVQLGHVRGALSFRVDGRIDDDFWDRNSEDPDVRVSRLTVEWRPRRDGPALRLGRQTVFAGGAPATIDGARPDFDVPRISWMRARLVGGALAPVRRELDLVSDPDRNWQFGGRLTARPHADLRFAAGGVGRRRRRPGFVTERADSLGNLFERIVEATDRAVRRGSIDASWMAHGRATIRGRADYDHLVHRLSRGEVSLRSDVGRGVSIDGGYTFRSPQLPATSIFSVFDADASHETEIGAAGRVRHGIRLRGAAARITRAGDAAYRTSITASTGAATLGYTRRAGYAGEIDGVTLGLHRSLRGGVVVPRVQGSWASSRPDPDRGERETLFAGVAGLSIRPRRALQLDGEIQILHNRYYDRDVRLLLRLSYRFFRRARSGPATAPPSVEEAE